MNLYIQQRWIETNNCLRRIQKPWWSSSMVRSTIYLDILNSIKTYRFAYKCCIEVYTFFVILFTFLDANYLQIMTKWLGKSLNSLGYSIFDGQSKYGFGMIKNLVGNNNYKGLWHITSKIHFNWMVFILVSYFCIIHIDFKSCILINIKWPFYLQVAILFFKTTQSFIFSVYPIKCYQRFLKNYDKSIIY
jgi:hypothetical protein